MILRLIHIKVMQAQNEKKMNKKFNASLSIEAAIAMSIFIIAVSSLLGPFIILKNNSLTLNQINNSISKNISYTKALETVLEKRSDKDDVISNLNKQYDIILLSSNTIYSIYKSVNDSIELCIPLNNDIYNEKTNIIEYDVDLIHKVPFSNILGVHVGQELVSSRRAFVGAHPARWNNSNDNINNDDVVFISKNASNSGVYHLSEFCTYLRHKLNEVTEKDAKKEHTVCSYCKLKFSDVKNKNKVYITQYGDSYHYSNNCPIIYAYIKKVLKSSVPDMHCCSKCDKESK